MSLRRICDRCFVPLSTHSGFLVDFTFKEDGMDICMDCYEKRQTEVNEAMKKLPSTVEPKVPPLGYHFYVEDAVMFPTYLEGSPGEAKILFMYDHTNSNTSRMQ